MLPRRAILPDGRLHFSHGPIDLVIAADGDALALQQAHEAAWRRFSSILAELVGELSLLKKPVGENCPLQGVIARRMWQACHPLRKQFITPMAAVAGSVAQEVIAAYARDGIARAAVNNGGDIALYLSAHASYRIGVCTNLSMATEEAMRGELQTDGTVLVSASSPVRGIATSGWRGRSFSLGIADSVTVLADTAAQADAAASIIANAVNVNDERIQRRPACDVKDDSDLGELPVTVDVPPLESSLVDAALQSGLLQARHLQRQGLIRDAVLACQGRMVYLGEEEDPSLRTIRQSHGQAPQLFTDAPAAPSPLLAVRSPFPNLALPRNSR